MKFIITLKPLLRKGIKRQSIVAASPVYRKKITTGLTITEERIPIGMSFPKRLKVMGAVKTWAPALSLIAEEILGKRRFPKKNFITCPMLIIPARAP